MKPPKPDNPDGKAILRKKREERLAAALRANLKRRKAVPDGTADGKPRKPAGTP